jgi:putative ABC transport system permease protein
MDPNWDWSLRNIFVKIKPDNIHETVDFIKTTAIKFSPDYPFDYSFLDDHFERQYRGDRQIGTIFQYFSFIAVFISCLGLFGLASFMAERRTKEIGVRKVLGASASGVAFLLSKAFTKWVIVSNLVAWPVAYFFMSRWLRHFAYRMPLGLTPFITSALIALGIAVLTVSYQSVKAALKNPVDSLRYE